MLEPEFVVSMVTTVGFPIAVTTYLLYERDKSTKAMVKTLNTIELLIRERL